MNMKKSDPHAGDREIRTTFGRIFMCGLAFCLLFSAIPAGVAASEAISFPDANLEAVVRDELGISEGDITDGDMTALRVLDADDKKISDLSGLEHAVNLRDLDLESNQVSDLGPLANLTSLWKLDLESNQVSDLGPLANLTALRDLDLEDNQVSDLGPLANLTNLRNLDLEDNQVSDLGPLANLTSLRELGLESNQVSDLGPLTNLTRLKKVDLEDNQVSDLSPLVDSELGRGVSVKLSHNDLDLSSGSATTRDIEVLKERGVDVRY